MQIVDLQDDFFREDNRCHDFRIWDLFSCFHIIRHFDGRTKFLEEFRFVFLQIANGAFGAVVDGELAAEYWLVVSEHIAMTHVFARTLAEVWPERQPTDACDRFLQFFIHTVSFLPSPRGRLLC